MVNILWTTIRQHLCSNLRRKRFFFSKVVQLSSLYHLIVYRDDILISVNFTEDFKQVKWRFIIYDLTLLFRWNKRPSICEDLDACNILLPDRKCHLILNVISFAAAQYWVNFEKKTKKLSLTWQYSWSRFPKSLPHG